MNDGGAFKKLIYTQPWIVFNHMVSIDHYISTLIDIRISICFQVMACHKSEQENGNFSASRLSPPKPPQHIGVVKVTKPPKLAEFDWISSIGVSQRGKYAESVLDVMPSLVSVVHIPTCISIQKRRRWVWSRLVPVIMSSLEANMKDPSSAYRVNGKGQRTNQAYLTFDQSGYRVAGAIFIAW